MSYKEKAIAPGGTYRGGALTVHEKPKPRRYPCFAAGCPMVGSIFPGAGVGGTGDAPGTCAWHYGVNPMDIPKVTQVLVDWQCVSFEINEARRTLTGELAANPRALQERLATAWERLKPLAPGWEEQLAPNADYSAWAKKLEAFLGARVVEVLSTHQRRAA